LQTGSRSIKDRIRASGRDVMEKDFGTDLWLIHLPTCGQSFYARPLS